MGEHHKAADQPLAQVRRRAPHHTQRLTPIRRADPHLTQRLLFMVQRWVCAGVRKGATGVVAFPPTLYVLDPSRAAEAALRCFRRSWPTIPLRQAARPLTTDKPSSVTTCVMPDAMRQVDLARADFAAIENHLDFIKGSARADTDADGQEGRAPDEINDGERQHGLPCWRTNCRFHGK